MELLDVLYLILKYHNVFNWKKSRLLVYIIDGSFVIVIKLLTILREIMKGQP